MHTSAEYIGLHEAPPLKNICPLRGFFCFITHGCYLRTVCDVSCSQSRLHRKYLPASRVFLFHNTRLLSQDRVRCTIIKIFNSPAFHSRVVKFSVPTSFPQTPCAHPSTHTHPNTSSGVRARARAHTQTASLARNPSKVPAAAAAAARPPLSTSAGLPVQLTH